MKDFFELRENKIFFVKVGDGRDSMTVKTKAPNSREAVKKLKSKYPKERVSLDQNQKQGQPAGALESVEEAYRKPTAAEIAADKAKERRASGNKGPDSSARYKNIKKKMYGNAMGGLKKEESELTEAPDLMKMSKELLKHKSKGVNYEKAAAYVRAIHNNSNVNVQDKAMKGLLDLLKNMDLTDRTTITKILKDNGFKVKGGRLMRESALEEGRNDVIKALSAKAKTGGVDKAEFQKSHDLYKAGKLQDLKKLIKNSDTDVAEYIADVISRHDSRSFNSMYPRAKSDDRLANIIREEKYAVKYTHPTDKKSGRTTGPMSKSAAEKKAAMGNKVDKVGGKYTVIRHVEESVEEATMADRRVLKAIRIAKDMAGNHTGATRAIEKLKKGLSDHPKVKAALQTHNESTRDRKDPYRPGAVGKDAQKRAHKSFQDVRQMASDMIRKKKNESVELEERTNSVKYSRKDFENTKKGDKLEIKWGDSISSGRSATFVVAGKSASKKYNVEKLRLEPEGKKGGVKFFLRSRNGGDATFSIGDMAAIMTSIKKV